MVKCLKGMWKSSHSLTPDYPTCIIPDNFSLSPYITDVLGFSFLNECFCVKNSLS